MRKAKATRGEAGSAYCCRLTTTVAFLLAFLLTCCNYVPRNPNFRFARKLERLVPGSRLRTDGFYLYTYRWQDNVAYQQLRFYPDGRFFDGPYSIDSAQTKSWTRQDWARQTGYYRVRDSCLFMEDFVGSYVRWAWRFGTVGDDSLGIIGDKVRGRLPRKTGVHSMRRMTPSIPTPQVYDFYPDPKS